MDSLRRAAALAAFVLVLLVLGAPPFANADTAADLQLQVAQLLADITAFQMQLHGAAGAQNPALQTQQTAPAQSQASAPPLSPYICPSTYRRLKLGSVGEDVADLQTFLSRDADIYPEQSVTGFFGPRTEAAVRRWQARYGIVNSGSAETTGWGAVGPVTGRLMQDVCKNMAPAATRPMPAQQSASSTGGACPLITKSYPQCLGTWKEVKNARGCTVDWICDGSPVTTSPFTGQFLATSTWGIVPLKTTFWTWILPNATGTYSIDFGDGTSDAAPRCQTYAYGCFGPASTDHTYTIPGTFTARLMKQGTAGIELLGQATIHTATSTTGL